MVGIEFDRTSLPKTSKHSLCHNSPCTNHSKIALSFEKHYILASLIKGEVLSPEKIRATTGVIAFLPHPFRFSDTSVNNHSIVGSASHCNRSSPLHKGAKGDSALPTIPKSHFPSKSTISLPPLSKVRCCRPKEFGRLPEGLSHQPFASHQPFKNRTIPLAFRRGVGLPLPLHPTFPSPQPL